MGEDVTPDGQNKKMIKLGVCAMEKKAGSKPMKAILERIKSTGHFEITIFPQQSILESPIEEWPHPIDVLISFFSDGFPLDKAEEYVALRRPHCINDLTAQRILLDRRRVYALLKENQVLCPNALVVERSGENHDLVGYTPDQFVESEDFIKLGNEKMSKPFVEKPLNAEDHNVCIYYPSSSGGGVKRLFRKVGDRASDFDQTAGQVRRDGSYMYEPFMQTQGTDIKVYTVGPNYAHAEARKSPVIDGVVMRNDDGKEIRFPVILTQKEKEFARRICLAFGQFVCGFDMLRTSEGSMVIDVNGWSFVKGMPKYYDDASHLLCAHMLQVCGMASVPRSVTVKRNSEVKKESETQRLSTSSQSDDQWAHKELLAVLAVVRHADRTPKNKRKMLTKRPDFIQLHQRWSAGPRKEAKLKSPKQLQELLDLTKVILGRKAREGWSGEEREGHTFSSAEGESGNSDGEDMKFMRQRTMSLDDDEREGCTLICAVLEEGGNFGGIYRKVQLKPVSWDADGNVEDLLVVLKYGGILTPAGMAQSEDLGRSFRSEMYPGEGSGADQYTTGLLRLHATQRHDLKIYSSDEGRVQMSAAAFARGLLALEKGSLTPICAALVETDSKMLDELPRQAEKQMSRAKQALHVRIHEPPPKGYPEMDPASPACPGVSVSDVDSNQELDSGNALLKNMLTQLHTALKVVVDELKDLDQSQVIAVPCAENADTEEDEATKLRPHICSISSPLLVVNRWTKLYSELWDAKKENWNISKVPEIFDAVQFDMIHFPKLVKGTPELFAIAKELNDIIVPQEYGHDVLSRLEIGSFVCGPLLKKLVDDLRCGRESIPTNDEQQADQKIVSATQLMQRFGDWLPEWMRKKSTKEAPKTKPLEEASPNAASPTSVKEEEEFLGLDPELARGVKSVNRRVRTRLYFTSESHIQALMNVLRYCHRQSGDLARNSNSSAQSLASTVESGNTSRAPSSKLLLPPVETHGSSGSEPPSPVPKPSIVQAEQETKLSDNPVFGYLTQIVFRLYEDKAAAPGTNDRYRVEVLFSPGAVGDPTLCKNHIMKVEKMEPLRSRPLTLSQILKLLGPCAEAGSVENSPIRSRSHNSNTP